MLNYELRLLNRNGGMLLDYVTSSESEFWQKVIEATDVPDVTFEIWRAQELVGTVSRLVPADA